MAGLDWGRKFLVCPPTYFGVLYEINPWMHEDVKVDPERALNQWNNLCRAFNDAGAELEVQEPVEGWPDLVFTANAGIVNGEQFVPTHFRNIERQGETRYDIDWFKQRDYKIDRLPATIVHEGAGDALPFGPADNRVLVSGYGTRSEAASHAYLSSLTGAAMASVKLIDPRLYHLDLTFTPIDDRRALIAGMAFDKQGQALINHLVPEPFFLEDEEACRFAATASSSDKTSLCPIARPGLAGNLKRGASTSWWSTSASS